MGKKSQKTRPVAITESNSKETLLSLVKSRTLELKRTTPVSLPAEKVDSSKSVCDHQLAPFNSAAPVYSDAQAASHGSMTFATNATSAPALTAVTPTAVVSSDSVPALIPATTVVSSILEDDNIEKLVRLAKDEHDRLIAALNVRPTNVVYPIILNPKVIAQIIALTPLPASPTTQAIDETFPSQVIASTPLPASPTTQAIVETFSSKAKEFKFNSHKAIKIAAVVIGTTVAVGLIIGGACFLLTASVIAAIAAASVAAVAGVSTLAVVGYKAVSNAKREVTPRAPEAAAAPVLTA